MNLATAGLFLSAVLLGMAMLCCAHAADYEAVNLQHRVAILNPDQPGNMPVLQTNTAIPDTKIDVKQAVPAVAPVPNEKQDDGTESIVQLKGVRG